MSAFIDLTAQRFGMLTVLRRAANNKHKKACWTCKCDCGSIKDIIGSKLRNGEARSCGCRIAILTKHRFTKHGLSDTHPLYGVWKNMRNRCNDPNHKSYKNYGGRGIAVCARWDSFAAFVEDMGERPSPLHSLDRRDNDGPYSPTNCQWATKKQQSQNSRRPVIMTANGISMNMSEWAIHLGINIASIYGRLKRGWPIELALTTPHTHRHYSPMNTTN